MRPSGRLLRLALALAAMVALALLFAGCNAFGGDQNTFAPEGDVAKQQRDLFLVVLWPAIVVLCIVVAALVYILVRYRRRSEDDPIPEQIHGNTRLELAWTIAPAALLIGITVPVVMGIIELGRDADEDALQVHVIAQRFNWIFEYPEITTPDGELLRTTDGVLHIPIDREIAVDLTGLDVIHSFWVPKLAGKQDAVPGRTNSMWFNATRPGVYAGQCAEFCGIGHSDMKFSVEAHTEEEFQAWVDEQLEGAPAP